MLFFLTILQLLTNPYTYPVLPQKGQTISDFIPKGYHMLHEYKGHLNEDTLMDITAILESDREIPDLKEEGHAQKPRILFVVFANPKGGYTLSVQSNESVLLSDDGGVFGDPLQELYIQNKCVCVDYYGGSAYKWAYTYKWRYQQNDWFLIGATHTSMSPHDNILEKYDFNLNTGKAEHTIMPWLEEEEGAPQIRPKTRRINPGKKPLYKLKNFVFGQNMVFPDLYF